jgi:hypothetical protein
MLLPCHPTNPATLLPAMHKLVFRLLAAAPQQPQIAAMPLLLL